jgi:hypothetical protein
LYVFILAIWYGTELLFLRSILVLVMTKAILSSGISITAN